MFRPVRTAALAVLIPLLTACDDNLFEDLLVFSGPAVTVATVEVTPFQATVSVGQTLQLAATLRDELGDVISGQPVNWSSSQPTIAAVNSAGLVTGLSTGVATVRATADGVSATATITVSGT